VILMENDSVNLLNQIYTMLIKAYSSIVGDKALLAFERMGLSISDAMFKLNPDDTTLSNELAIQHMSQDFASHALNITDNYVQSGMITYEWMVQLLLDAIKPIDTDSDSIQLMGKLKNEVRGIWDSTLGSFSGIPGDVYHPVYAMPDDWYKSGNMSGWTPYNISQNSGTAQPTTPSVLGPLNWSVLPKAKRSIITKPFVQLDHPLLLNRIRKEVLSKITEQPTVQLKTEFMPTSIKTQKVDIKTQKVEIAEAVRKKYFKEHLVDLGVFNEQKIALCHISLVDAVKDLHSETTPQQVTSQGIDISFDYRFISLRRQWWPVPLLLLKRWFIPGFERGAISGGTNVLDQGMMPVLTTGFVAVRNLRVKCNWSSQDMSAITNSSAIGPFSLIGRSINNGTLSCNGIQIIGWFYVPLPCLPPCGDPNLATTAANSPLTK